MATSRTSDINLVIRARNEADAAITSAAAALETLYRGTEHADGGLAALGSSLANLDKLMASLAQAQERSGSGAAKQAAAAHAAATSLAEQQERAETLRRGLAALREEQGRGGVTPQRHDELKALTGGAENDLADAEAKIRRYTVALERSLGAVQTTRTAQLELRRAEAETADAQATVAAHIELTTQALLDQERAARSAAAAQTLYNNKAAPGLTRPALSASDGDRTSLLLAADREFERREQAQAAQRTREAAAIRAAAEANAGVTGTRATDAGAGFSALAAREEAEAVRQAALAHAEFERRVRAGAEAMREADAVEAKLVSDAVALRAALDPLAAEQAKYNAELDRYRALAAAGKISATELGAAELLAAKRLEEGRTLATKVHTDTPGLFGLRPYELQNFSYQINDIVTQLGSGTSLSQTLAQQGGQIFQLFQARIGPAVVGALSNPGVLAGIAALATLALGLKSAADQAERLRDAEKETTYRADGGSYSVKGIVDAELALTALGEKATDASAAVKTLLDSDIDASLIQQFGRAAQETAKYLGVDLKTALGEAATAFTGGYDAVAKLDDKLHFLTASEREHIRALFEEGNFNAARIEFLAAYTRQADAVAAKQRGPWSEAAHSLGVVLRSIYEALGNSAPTKIATGLFDGLAHVVDETAKGFLELRDAIGKLEGIQPKKVTDNVAGSSAAARAKAIADVQAEIAHLDGEIVDAAGRGMTAFGAQLKQRRDAVAASLLALERTAPDTVNGSPNSTEAKRRSDELDRISREDRLQQLRDAGQTRILTAQEQADRARLAGEEAAKSATDSIVAAALRRKAIAHETAEIEKESDARAKSAVVDREKAIKDFERTVVGAEGAGPNKAGSSAAGYGQFTESTYLKYFAKVYGDTGQARGDILATRNDPAVAKGVLDALTRDNAKAIEAFGGTVKAGTLYLAHIFGVGTSGGPTKALINADDATPVDQVLRGFGNFPTIARQNAGYLRSEGGKGRYKTAGEFRKFIDARVGDVGSPQAEGQVAINKLLDDAKKKQDDFNLAVQHGAEDRQRAIDAARTEFGLYGTALLIEQRRQAEIKAGEDRRQEAEDANKNRKPGEAAVVVAPEQIANAERLAGALFDAAHAKDALVARRDEVTRPQEGLQEEFALLTQQRDFLLSIGENKAAETVERQMDSLRPKLREAINEIIEFYQALTPEQRVSLGIVDQQQLDNTIAKLKQAKQATQEWGKVAGVSGRDIAAAFAGAAVNSFTNFINKIAQGKSFFKSLGESVQEFAASFISSIAQMILKLLAYAAAVSILRALGVPVPTGAAASIFHGGGVAGQGSVSTRNVSPLLFAGAMRYHTGGITGLRPNEVPIIAEEGEEILTRSDPRHRANGGGAGLSDAKSVGVTVINVPDHDAAVQQALRRPAGEKLLLNFLADNRTAVKAALN